MIKIEVKSMDNEMEKQPQEEAAENETVGYVPRPSWQVWLARIALVLFLIIVFGQIYRIARGGL